MRSLFTGFCLVVGLAGCSLDFAPSASDLNQGVGEGEGEAGESEAGESEAGEGEAGEGEGEGPSDPGGEAAGPGGGPGRGEGQGQGQGEAGGVGEGEGGDGPGEGDRPGEGEGQGGGEGGEGEHGEEGGEFGERGGNEGPEGGAGAGEGAGEGGDAGEGEGEGEGGGEGADDDTPCDYAGCCADYDDHVICMDPPEMQDWWDPAGTDWSICVAGRCVRPGCGQQAQCGVGGPPPFEPGGGGGNGGDDDERFEVIGDDQAVVWDLASGLMWERRLGDPDVGNFDWREAVEHCRAVSTGGFDDWRLANRYELLDVADHDAHRPAFDEILFPEVPSDERLWTSTALDANSRYALKTEHGEIERRNRNDDNRVACVRGPDPAYRQERRERFVVQTMEAAGGREGRRVVRDTRTGLVWQGEERQDDDWDDARVLCSGAWAGQANWRLPTLVELASLIDDRVGAGALIDHEAFPNWQDRSFWSATTSHDDPGDRYWTVNFDNGDVRRKADHESAEVRCVTEADPAGGR